MENKENMETIATSYLTKDQAIEKYKFLTKNMLKNILHKNIGGFRDKVVRRLGNRILLDEMAFLKFLSNCKDTVNKKGEE